MNRTALVVAILLALGLAGYVWYVKTSDAEEGQVLLHEPVLLIPREQVVELEIVRQGGLEASLRHGEDGWETVSGPPGVDPERVPDVLYNWSLVRAVDRIEDPEAASSYGLDPASLHIRCVSREGTSAVLDLGNEAPMGGEFYAELDERPDLYLVDVGAINLLAEVDVMLGLAEDPDYGQ